MCNMKNAHVVVEEYDHVKSIIFSICHLVSAGLLIATWVVAYTIDSVLAKGWIGTWAPPMYILAGIFGLLAARKKTVCMLWVYYGACMGAVCGMTGNIFAWSIQGLIRDPKELPNQDDLPLATAMSAIMLCVGILEIIPCVWSITIVRCAMRKAQLIGNCGQPTGNCGQPTAQADSEKPPMP